MKADQLPIELVREKRREEDGAQDRNEAKSWEKWDRLYEKELSISCPSCGVQAGERCKQVRPNRFNGLWSFRPTLKRPHLKRLLAAQ